MSFTLRMSVEGLYLLVRESDNKLHVVMRTALDHDHEHESVLLHDPRGDGRLTQVRLGDVYDLTGLTSMPVRVPDVPDFVVDLNTLVPNKALKCPKKNTTAVGDPVSAVVSAMPGQIRGQRQKPFKVAGAEHNLAECVDLYLSVDADEVTIEGAVLRKPSSGVLRVGVINVLSQAIPTTWTEFDNPEAPIRPSHFTMLYDLTDKQLTPPERKEPEPKESDESKLKSVEPKDMFPVGDPVCIGAKTPFGN